MNQLRKADTLGPCTRQASWQQVSTEKEQALFITYRYRWDNISMLRYLSQVTVEKKKMSKETRTKPLTAESIERHKFLEF